MKKACLHNFCFPKKGLAPTNARRPNAAGRLPEKEACRLPPLQGIFKPIGTLGKMITRPALFFHLPGAKKKLCFKKQRKHDRSVYLALGVLLIALSVLSSGCLKLHTHVTINRDKTADVDVTFAADKTLARIGTFLYEDIFDDISTGLKEEGFAVSDYSDNQMVGFVARNEGLTAEDLKGVKPKKLTGGLDVVVIEPTTVEKSIFSIDHHFSARVNLGEMTVEEKRLARLVEPDMAFILSLPMTPLGHNAHSVSEDGKTLEWKLALGEINHIKVSIREPNLRGIALVLLVALVLIALLIALVFYLAGRNKPRKWA